MDHLNPVPLARPDLFEALDLRPVCFHFYYFLEADEITMTGEKSADMSASELETTGSAACVAV